jgi:hypothetical protein
VGLRAALDAVWKKNNLLQQESITDSLDA